MFLTHLNPCNHVVRNLSFQKVKKNILMIILKIFFFYSSDSKFREKKQISNHCIHLQIVSVKYVGSKKSQKKWFNKNVKEICRMLKTRGVKEVFYLSKKVLSTLHCFKENVQKFYISSLKCFSKLLRWTIKHSRVTEMTLS